MELIEASYVYLPSQVAYWCVQEEVAREVEATWGATWFEVKPNMETRSYISPGLHLP